MGVRLAVLAALAAVAAAYQLPLLPDRLVTRGTVGHEPPPITKKARRLHKVARAAVKRGEWNDALQCYAAAVEDSGAARAFLLLALHLQRLNDHAAARAAFSSGVVADRTDGQLMQAWALFESKYGSMARASSLIKRAVKLDPSLKAVLRWDMWRRIPPPQAQSGPPATFVVQEPPVKYTIPSAPRGWKGRPEEGEDPEAWYDDEGRRNGPPQNYWRQAMDERLREADMDYLRAVLRGERDGPAAAAVLEERMKVRAPGLNRKLLGQWASIVADGELVAHVGPDGRINTPAIIGVRRAGRPKIEEHRYGERDAHLGAEEALLVELRLPSPELNVGRGTVCAGEVSAGRARVPIAPLAGGASTRLWGGGGVPLGGIFYLSDYLLAQRSTTDATRGDVWVRCDVGSYCGAAPTDAQR